jgi:hypothetical protein
LVEASPKIPVKDKAQLRALGFVPPSIVGSRPRCQGSAINARFAGALDTAPGSQEVQLSLDNADDVIHDTRFPHPRGVGASVGIPRLSPI